MFGVGLGRCGAAPFACLFRTGVTPTRFIVPNRENRPNCFSSFSRYQLDADVRPHCAGPPSPQTRPQPRLECLPTAPTPSPSTPHRGGRESSHPRKGHEKQAALRSHAALYVTHSLPFIHQRSLPGTIIDEQGLYSHVRCLCSPRNRFAPRCGQKHIRTVQKVRFMQRTPSERKSVRLPFSNGRHTPSPLTFIIKPRDLRKIDSRIPNLVPTILIRKEAILVGFA